MEYTKQEIEEIRNCDLKKDEKSVFLHCNYCMNWELPKDKSPKEFGNYEVSTAGIELSTGKTVRAIAVWCKNCGRLVWDSRHLKHAY